MHDPSDLAVVIVRGSCVLSVKFVSCELLDASHHSAGTPASSYASLIILSSIERFTGCPPATVGSQNPG